MSAESAIRQRVCGALRKAGLDPISVENPVHPGTPDVNYLFGWIELKQLKAWPKRAETPVRVPTFTGQQRVWLARRDRASALRPRGIYSRSWLLLRVGDEWLLLTGAVAALSLGLTTEATLKSMAVRYWPDGLNEKELIECLSPR